ncbi:PadR family transcriptional regulator [Paenibacillus apiarius]|uniref:PadR family transcriptional regulator n=1 Tax=Paenibacillus apiarius TaxID=46240 RepID=UPI003B3B37A0
MFVRTCPRCFFHTAIDHTVGIFYSASYGSLYPALKRLADKQLVNVTVIGDSKNKKVYSILPAGKEAFLVWLSQPLQLTKNEHLLKIFFYDYLDEGTRRTRLAEYRIKVASDLAHGEDEANTPVDSVSHVAQSHSVLGQ